MIHLRINFEFYDLVCRSGFFVRTGKPGDRDKTPVVADGEPRTLKNHHKGDTHIHRDTHTYWYHILPNLFINRYACNNLFYKAPNRHLKFISVCTPIWFWSLGLLFYVFVQIGCFLYFCKNTAVAAQRLFLCLIHYCCSIYCLLTNLVSSDSGQRCIIIPIRYYTVIPFSITDISYKGLDWSRMGFIGFVICMFSLAQVLSLMYFMTNHCIYQSFGPAQKDTSTFKDHFNY